MVEVGGKDVKEQKEICSISDFAVFVNKMT